MRIVPILLMVGVSLLQPAATAAQVLTGSLSGTVRDEQGGLIAGAQVRVSSVSLIGGSESATTDARGQFRFPALTPGSYVLDVNVPKFVPYQVTAIRIGLGDAVDANAVLSRQSFTAAVTVVGSPAS